MNEITQDQLVKVVPANIRNRINQELIDTINNIEGNEIFKESFRDNLLGYTSVMKDGRFKIQSYIDAVQYVSHKLLGCSNIQAYTKTFPDRFQRFVDEGTTDKDIASYVSAYNKNQLVNKILEQTLVPTHVLNADIYQKAINTQAELMMTANSEKVRSDAANSLLTHLKPPETTKIELDVGIKNDSLIDDLRKTTMELAAQQKQLIEKGILNTKEIAESKIIEGEIIE